MRKSILFAGVISFIEVGSLSNGVRLTRKVESSEQEKSLNKLPDEVKDVLQKVAVEYRDHVAGIAMDRADASRDAYVAGGGTVVKVSQDARVAWANSMPNIAKDWAQKLDSQGSPGTAMLKAYTAKLKAAGATPVRDWANEF